MSRCVAAVYHLRRTDRTKSGFEMHYTQEQCKRAARLGHKTCWQHYWMPYDRP